MLSKFVLDTLGLCKGLGKTEFLECCSLSSAPWFGWQPPADTGIPQAHPWHQEGTINSGTVSL